MRKAKVRLCTYNVHCFLDEKSRPNEERIKKEMEALQPDILCLQESGTRHEVTRLAESIGMHPASIGEIKRWGISNSILTPLPVAEQRVVPLPYSRILAMATIRVPVTRKPEGAGAKGAKGEGKEERRKGGKVEGKEEKGKEEKGKEEKGKEEEGQEEEGQEEGIWLPVFCVHLDHEKEERRMEQLEEVLDFIQKGWPGPHVVAGDFNALRLADYTELSLANVAGMRKKNSRQEPRGHVVDRMDRAGYVDCQRVGLWQEGLREGLGKRLEKGLEKGRGKDATPFEWEGYQQSLEEGGLRREGKEIRTCWAGTRIDFVWLSRSLALSCSSVSVWRVLSDASDHFPVCCDIEWAV